MSPSDQFALLDERVLADLFKILSPVACSGRIYGGPFRPASDALRRAHDSALAPPLTRSPSSPVPARGIGAATAKALAARARMSCSSRVRPAGWRRPKKRSTKRAAPRRSRRWIWSMATRSAGCPMRSRERWGKLDILLINAAMLGTLAPVPSIDPKEFSRLLTLNVGANQALIAAFDPLLRRSEAARVAVLTSSVGAHPRAYWGAYGASKAALETLLLAYAEEMSGLGDLRVAIVDPGATATAMRRDGLSR
jgi:NAD(P)-dependent dehydrogenase (short-subunit alcohol dehydrogenase family)